MTNVLKARNDIEADSKWNKRVRLLSARADSVGLYFMESGDFRRKGPTFHKVSVVPRDPPPTGSTEFNMDLDEAEAIIENREQNLG